MTTLTWIYIIAGLVMGTIALISFLGMRKMRSALNRQSLFFWGGQFVTSIVFGILFFRGIPSVIYFATIAAIYIPIIVWIFRLPKDDHAA